MIMKAILVKETEKAVQLTYRVEIYGEFFVIKNVWFPKSMLDNIEINGNEISFTPKNDWILNKKTREYCKDIYDMFYPNVRQELKTFMSGINNEFIDYCFI